MEEKIKKETKEKIPTTEDVGVKRQYSLNFILKSSLNTEETDKYRAGLNEKIQKVGGQIGASLCSDTPRQFVYPINKEFKGYFCECVFDILPKDLKNIEGLLKPDPQIIRYMLEQKSSVGKRQKKSSRAKGGLQRLPYHASPETLRMPSTKPSEMSDKSSSAIEQTTPKEMAEAKEKREKVNMEEIEKKLDEIIDNI